MPKIVKYTKNTVDVSFLNRRLDMEIVDYYDRPGCDEFVKLVCRARFSDADGQISIPKNGAVLPVTLKRQKMLKSQDDYLDYYQPMEIWNIPYMTAQEVRNDTSYYFIFKEISGMK